MQLIAQGLSSPQIQERLAAINQQLQQSQLARGQQRGDRGLGGLSI